MSKPCGKLDVPCGRGRLKGDLVVVRWGCWSPITTEGFLDACASGVGVQGTAWVEFKGQYSGENVLSVLITLETVTA